MKINSNPDYTFHRLHRTRGPKGGVAILAKKGINHNLLPHFGTKLVEALGIKIYSNSSKILFITADLPGGASRLEIDSHYRNDLKILLNRNESFFIFGDLNSKHRLWNWSQANQAGKIIFEELNQNDFLIFHRTTPTYNPLTDRKSPSTLDLVLTNGRHNISQPVCVQEFMSDHNAVIFEVHSNQILETPISSIHATVEQTGLYS
jgi:Endonuclease-reverse transcriptase